MSWPEEEFHASYTHSIRALNRSMGQPLPLPHLQTAFPRRPAFNRSCHWFVALCFLHLGWEDAESLRTLLRSVFESTWWATNTAPGEAVRTLQFFVRGRRCLFCNHQHQSDYAAMSCVYQHINFSPS
ncbi:hypothetical protein FRC14_005185 [Serendipita sp. 396]|nr:hypothetical protein FRC14_005185 [Serendipita sp. 396]KAG8867450.1 hypothetical protein FRC20_005726 [Serendipita sp. 405]